MRRPPLLLVLLAALAAAGLIWWSLQDAPPSAPSDPLEAGDDIPRDSGAPNLMSARRDEIPGEDAQGTLGGGAGTLGQAASKAFVTGVVRDETGRGIDRATIVLHEVDPEGLRGAPFPDKKRLAETTTDRDGTFRLDAQSNRWLRVVASADGRATVGKRIASAGAHVVIVLPVAGTLRLEIRTHDGKAAADTRVRAQSAESVFDAVVGGDGVLTLPTLPPGLVRVRAVAAGGASVVAGPFAIRASETTDASLVLPRSIRVEGVVVDDATGTPVQDAEVHVSHPGRSDAAEPTDAQGRFGPVAGGGAGERVFVAVRAEGYVPLLEAVVLRASDLQALELRLVRGDAWTGVVRRASGAKTGQVHVSYTADGVAGRASASTMTDEDGSFTLPPPPNPAPGRRVVLVARDETSMAALALRPDTPRPDSLVLTLRENTAVSGRVQDAAGSDLPGVVVRLMPAWDQVPRGARISEASARLLAVNEEGFQGLSAATGPVGRWTVRGVPAGPYRLEYEFGGARYPGVEILEVKGASTQAPTQKLGGGRTLEGRVRDERGSPLAGATVRVAPENTPTSSRRALTDADGRFEIDGLTAGRVRVSVTWAGRDPLIGYADIEADKDTLIELDFDAAAVLEGRLQANDKGYTGVFTLALHAGGGRSAARRTLHARAKSGAFRIEGVPSGTWTVEVWTPSGQRGRATDVEIVSGSVATATLDLLQAARLEGTILRSDNRPAAGARVTLNVHDTGRRLIATADQAGRYRFENLLPGLYGLAASGRGGAPTSGDVDLAAGMTGQRDLQLPTGGVLNVLVLDARRRPVRGALLSFQSAEGTVRLPRPLRTDASGKARAVDLPAGETRVRARAQDGRSVEGRVLVDTEAASSSIELTLPAKTN